MSTHTPGNKKSVAVDFDAVLNDYTGWQGVEHLGQPRENCQQFLAHLADQYLVIIHSTREPHRIRAWLQVHGLEAYIADVTQVKPAAIAYVDDRAIRFDGDYFAVLQELATFKPYWEKDE